jgi:hypothetical protein
VADTPVTKLRTLSLSRSSLANLLPSSSVPEALVEEVGELPRVPGDGVDELGDLVDEERAEGGDEHDHHPDEDGKDGGRGQAAPPAATGQVVGGRFHREGQEERDEQHHDQASQPPHQPEADTEDGRAKEQEHDRPLHPGRHPRPGSSLLARVALAVSHGRQDRRPPAGQPHPGRMRLALLISRPFARVPSGHVAGRVGP